jgi:hypothetical protein
VGYFATGRDMGSSVPYGAKPLPADTDAAPPSTPVKLALSIASCTSVCGCRRSMKPSPQPPHVSSPSGCVSPSKLSVVRSTMREPGLSRLNITAGCVALSSVSVTPSLAPLPNPVVRIGNTCAIPSTRQPPPTSRMDIPCDIPSAWPAGA